MKKREIALLAGFCFFCGAFFGFMMAPIKAGVECGNNNTTHQYFSDKKDALTVE